MKILVCISKAPDTTAKIAFTENNTKFDSNGVQFIINPYDGEIIIEEMNNPPSLPDLAKEVGLNIKKLKTDFKEFYGVPVFTFLLNYKMELAKKMLQEQQLNVNELAIHLGYSTSSHFIAAFKRKFGTTPKQFAKS